GPLCRVAQAFPRSAAVTLANMVDLIALRGRGGTSPIASLLSIVSVTRRGNASCSNRRGRRVVLWRIGWSPRTAKGEKPSRIRFSTLTQGWAIVPWHECGGWVGNGAPRI